MKESPGRASVSLKGLQLEYSLVAVFILILMIERLVRKFAKQYTFREIPYNPEEKYLVTWDTLPSLQRLPIIGSLLYAIDFKNSWSMMKRIGRQFGPVFRFSFMNEQFVALNDGDSIQTLLQSTSPEHIIKAPIFYDLAIKDVMGNGLIMSSGSYWKSHRRILNPAFSFKSFQNYTRLFGKYSSKLVHELEALFADSRTTHTINASIHLCTMQIISEAIMGLDLCNDEDGKEFYACIRRAKEIPPYRLERPYLLIDPIWKRSPTYKELQQIIATVNGISSRMIALKRKNLKDLEDNSTSEETEDDEYDDIVNGRTMIDEMVRAGMSDAEILDEVNTMIFAGFETTGASVHYLMFLLAINPEHQKICQDEVDAVMSDPMKCPGGTLTYDGVGDLKYTERCFFEALRLFPPIFGFGRKLEKPLKISDTLVVPAGTNVVVGPINMHINPEYFPDPNRFDPDRFLPQNVKQRHPYAFIPFSSGSRNCIGSKFAVMAAKTMSAYILRNFDVHTTDNFDSVRVLANVFSTPERDYNFILKRR